MICLHHQKTPFFNRKMDDKYKKLDTYLKPKAEIFEKLLRSSEETSGDADVFIFSDPSLLAALLEIEKFFAIRDKVEEDRKNVMNMYSAISSKKFVVLGSDDIASDVVSESGSKDILKIECGDSKISVTYVSAFKASVFVSGFLVEGKPVFESLKSDGCGSQAPFFIPADEFIFIVDEKRFAEHGITQASAGEDGVTRFVDNKLSNCSIYMLL